MIPHYSDFKDRIESVEGLLLPGEDEFLFNMSAQMPEDGIIVEMGSYLGKSSVSLGFPCLGTNRKVYCIDVWGTESWLTSWKGTIDKFGLSNHVIPLKGYAVDVLLDWVKLTGGVKIDMLFNDTSHCLPSILSEFISAYPWVKNNGMIAFHDFTHPSYPDVAKVWEVAKTLLLDHKFMGSIAIGRKTPVGG
jgi:predicted O-methyltransferase YrrM